MSVLHLFFITFLSLFLPRSEAVTPSFSTHQNERVRRNLVASSSKLEEKIRQENMLEALLSAEKFSLPTCKKIKDLVDKERRQFLVLYRKEILSCEKKFKYSVLFFSFFLLFLYSFSYVGFTSFFVLFTLFFFVVSLTLQLLSLQPSIFWGMAYGFSLGFFFLGYFYYLVKGLFISPTSRNEKIAKNILVLFYGQEGKPGFSSISDESKISHSFFFSFSGSWHKIKQFFLFFLSV